jgi:hypothetical protein
VDESGSGSPRVGRGDRPLHVVVGEVLDSLPKSRRSERTTRLSPRPVPKLHGLRLQLRDRKCLLSSDFRCFGHGHYVESLPSTEVLCRTGPEANLQAFANISTSPRAVATLRRRCSVVLCQTTKIADLRGFFSP